MTEFIESYAGDIRNEWTWGEAPSTDHEAYRFVVTDLLEDQWDVVRDDARAAYAEDNGREPDGDGEWAAWLIAEVCGALGIGE